MGTSKTFRPWSATLCSRGAMCVVENKFILRSLKMLSRLFLHCFSAKASISHFSNNHTDLTGGHNGPLKNARIVSMHKSTNIFNSCHSKWLLEGSCGFPAFSVVSEAIWFVWGLKVALCCICVFLITRPEEIGLVSDTSRSTSRLLQHIPDQILTENKGPL